MIAAAAGLAWMAVASAGAAEPSRQRATAAIVAEINGEAITLEELEKSATAELLNLSLQRQRILEAALERMVAGKVIALEAKVRGLTEGELLRQEVYSKIAVPTDPEIESYYRARPELMKQSQEQAAAQIRQTLLTERRQQSYSQYAARLMTRYGAKLLLQPFRIQVDDVAPPARGPAGAPVTIVEFSDFECPFCKTLAQTLSQVTKQYANVRLVFRQFPLERIHLNALKAAEASICASDQGKFWEMHDQMFSGGPLTEAELLKKAAEAGLQAQEFRSCLSSGKAAERVRADMKAGIALGVSSTPTIFINGRPMRGAVAYPAIVKVIEEELRVPRKPSVTQDR